MQTAAEQSFAAARSADQNIYFPLPRQAPGHGMRVRLYLWRQSQTEMDRQQGSQG